MPPEETKPADTTPPVPEAPSPIPEPATPEPVQVVPEPSPAPVEAIPTPPEVPVEVQTAQPEPPFEQPQDKPTAQIPVNEPIAPKSSFPSEVPMREPLPPPAPVVQVPASVFAPVANFARELAVKARAVIQSRKRKKLEKIMEVVNAKGKITNDQVEKLLHVSDATATRYLAQLEKEGKVKQEGKTGKGVSYLKI